jgi:hypothetical protein
VKTLHEDTRPFWMQRIFAFVKFKAFVATELWVSQLDGSQMHKIGHVAELLEDDDATDFLLSDLQWLPDGKRLSFEYNDGLWTVPADG